MLKHLCQAEIDLQDRRTSEFEVLNLREEALQAQAPGRPQVSFRLPPQDDGRSDGQEGSRGTCASDVGGHVGQPGRPGPMETIRLMRGQGKKFR